MSAAYVGSSTENGIAFVQENAHLLPVILGVIGAFAALFGVALWSRRAQR